MIFPISVSEQGDRKMFCWHFCLIKEIGFVGVRGIFLSRMGPILVKYVLKWLAISDVSSVSCPFMVNLVVLILSCFFLFIISLIIWQGFF
jgi:hypothetical protein